MFNVKIGTKMQLSKEHLLVVEWVDGGGWQLNAQEEVGRVASLS